MKKKDAAPSENYLDDSNLDDIYNDDENLDYMTSMVIKVEEDRSPNINNSDRNTRLQRVSYSDESDNNAGQGNNEFRGRTRKDVKKSKRDTSSQRRQISKKF